jgi:hypothetical protein
LPKEGTVTNRSDKARWAGACARLRSIRGKSERSPRYLPADFANEYDGLLDDLDALGFDIEEFRILPYELQRFASYVVVAPGDPIGPPEESGYYLARSLLNGRIDSALTYVGGVGLTRK